MLHTQTFITKDDWEISYLVKNDSTKYTDLYIKWQNQHSIGIIKRKNSLETRRQLIPRGYLETEDYIYLSHSCGTDCTSFLVLTKEKNPRYRFFMPALFINNEAEIIFSHNEETSSLLQECFAFQIADLKNKKEYNIYTENVCLGSMKTNCFENVEITAQEIIIDFKLLENKKRINKVLSSKIIKRK